ncbi:T9SS type A sorting domain-containing protein [Oceanihabitans sp.]|nr:T9SS type A sorting domain-containing protein [Oceanihabitans sp.]
MRKIQTLILLAVCSISFAQSDLYVSDDSYVYVDGTAFASGPTVAPLFVTDDVNINTTGHIYLRNEAQLLQGTATVASTNNGNGKLSVFQTGTSNTYMYNYWCSPVGINSGGAGNTVFTPNVNFYYETAAPITSSLYGYIGGYDGTTTQIANYWLYTFIGTAPNPFPNDYPDWQGLGAGPGSISTGGLSNGTLDSGYGFTMKGNPLGSQEYDFRGRPNDGTLTMTLNPERETLVGNPYPSALDSRAFLHTNGNQLIIDSATLTFWEQKPGSTSHVLANYEGGYATYTINASGGVVEMYTPATFDTYNVDGTINTVGGTSTSGKTVRRYIPIGQGFMVKGNGTGGTLRTTNTMRTFQKESDGSSEFFRTSEPSERANEEQRYTDDGLFIMPDDYKRFRLNLDFNETYTRQLAQTFHHTATAGEDYGLETRSPATLDSDVYWPQGEKAYNAQAFAFDTELHIPLVINTSQDQPIRFRIFDIQNFDDSQPIFVHDIETDVYVDLRQQNYEINLPQGNYSDRFEIVFQDQSLSIEAFYDEDFLVLQNNNTSQLTILNPNQLEVQTVSLFDVSGKRIFNEFNLEAQDRYQFTTKNLSDGVYIAKITFANQSSMSKKVVVSNNN